jgi:S1-C subfamily serine protease
MNKILFKIILTLFLSLGVCAVHAEVYLGLYLTEHINVDQQNKDSVGYGLKVHNVIADSPADEAKLKAGDTLLKVENQKLISVDQLAKLLQDYQAGDVIKIQYLRQNKSYLTELTLKDKELSSESSAYLGVLTSKFETSGKTEFNYGLRIDYLYPDSPLHKYKLQVGDVILSLNNEKLYTSNQLETMLNNYSCQNVVEFIIKTNDNDVRTIKVQLNHIPVNGLWQELDLADLEGKIDELLDKSKTFIFRYESQDDNVIGIEISSAETDNDSLGVVITKIIANSPAEKAKLQKNDIIVKVDDTDIYTASDLINTIQAVDAGSSVQVVLNRGMKKIITKVEVVKRKSIFK